MKATRFTKNLITIEKTIKQAMEALNGLEGKHSFTLFVVNEKNQLLGTLTDGDIRRGLLAGKNISDGLETVMHSNFRYLERNTFGLMEIDKLREDEIDLVPLLNSNKQIIRIIVLSEKRSVLPVDAFIMAGGEGRRLRPLTVELPKPLLKVGSKPIIEHNIDRLQSYGVDNIYISVNYLAHKLEDYFEDGSNKDLNINYIRESKPLGTIGSLTLVNNFMHDTILIMNSDLLTNIDFEDFYRMFIDSGADMAVAGVPYKVDIPYAVMECEGDNVISFKEKPTYTFYSNAGIYFLKRKLVELIPNDVLYNATDLMDSIITKGLKLVYYPIHGYWLDIGQHEDYKKAQEDIKHIKL